MAEGEVRALAVVVPARDEESVLGRCLAAVHRARLSATRLGVPGLTVVVADSCTDATAALARAAGARVLETGAGTVGAARSAGIALALRALGGVPARRVWLACTDADSTVPPDWLVAQLRVARAGYDAAAGLVDVDDAGPRSSRGRWRSRYAASCRRDWLHGRVHGANLGVRAEAYRAVGGFEPVAEHEDARLVRRLQAHGWPVAWPERPVVVTSARRRSRTAAGVAADLRALA